jgi:hypothetical protein
MRSFFFERGVSELAAATRGATAAMVISKSSRCSDRNVATPENEDWTGRIALRLSLARHCKSQDNVECLNCQSNASRAKLCRICNISALLYIR